MRRVCFFLRLVCGNKDISVALLLYPGLGLALSESEQWRSFELVAHALVYLCVRLSVMHVSLYNYLCGSQVR